MLLLDEIEKAAADVFDTLMGVFDEGRLTDQYGRVTNFRSTIVVMTSNLGAGQGRAVGFEGEDAGPAYQDVAMKFFRPEFFNRMDAVVTFRPLLPATVKAIARRELDAIAKRGWPAAGCQFGGRGRWWTTSRRWASTRGTGRAPCSGPSSARWSPRWPGGCWPTAPTGRRSRPIG